MGLGKQQKVNTHKNQLKQSDDSYFTDGSDVENADETREEYSNDLSDESSEAQTIQSSPTIPASSGLFIAPKDADKKDGLLAIAPQHRP